MLCDLAKAGLAANLAASTRCRLVISAHLRLCSIATRPKAPRMVLTEALLFVADDRGRLLFALIQVLSLMGLLRLVKFTLIVLILAAILLHRMVDRRIRLQVFLIENTVLNVLKFAECSDDSALLTDMNFAATFLHFLKAFVLAVQLLAFEVSDTSGSIFKFRCIVDHCAQTLSVVEYKLAEVAIDCDHTTYVLWLRLPQRLLIVDVRRLLPFVTCLVQNFRILLLCERGNRALNLHKRLFLEKVGEIVMNSSTVPCHLQLAVDIAHDLLQPGEETNVKQMLLELFEEISVQFALPLLFLNGI